MGVFNRMGLKVKLISGSCGSLAMIAALGVISYMGISSLLESNGKVDHTHGVIQQAMNIEASAVDMETGMRGYLLAGQDGFLDPYNAGGKRFDSLVNDLRGTVSDNPAQVQLLGEISGTIDDWKSNVTESMIALRRDIGTAKNMDDMADLIGEAKGKVYFDKFRGQVKTFREREEALLAERVLAAESITNINELRDAAAWIDHTHEVIQQAMKIEASAVDMETGMRGYLLAGQDGFLDPYRAGNTRFSSLVTSLKSTVSDNPSQVALLGEIESTINQWQTKVTEPTIELRRQIGDAETMNDMAALVGEARGKVYFDKFRGQIKTFRDREQQLMTERQVQAETTAHNAKMTIVVGVSLTVLLSLFVTMFTAASIMGKFKEIFHGLTSFSTDELSELGSQFNEIIGSLDSGAANVSSASGQIASGASSQAASIEETSASLAVVASSTKDNAASSGKANQSMSNVSEVVAEANGTMASLTKSMSEISESSEDISKIIKTIDEIAFQTNLLALNAAVEAARAGDAGKGFAVVAEEVRNLAQRSAEAAKDTSALIEQTVCRVAEGSELVSQTSQAFDKITENANVVQEIVMNVAASSDDQASQVSQVNQAVVEMEKIIQSNSASTEEMSAQAEDLAGIVEALKGIAGNEGGHVSYAPSRSQAHKTTSYNPSPSFSGNKTPMDLDMGDFVCELDEDCLVEI
jgi:methyl-accepting chemotaxis protein